MLRLLAPKTHNSYRKIPFFGEAEEMFLKQKEKTDHLKKALGNRWRATGEYADLVFVTTMGSPVLRYHAEKEIKKVVKEINEQEAFESVQEQREPHYFEDMYPHAIRHTFCSRCFEADMQPKVVQSIMGTSITAQPLIFTRMYRRLSIRKRLENLERQWNWRKAAVGKDQRRPQILE